MNQIATKITLKQHPLQTRAKGVDMCWHPLTSIHPLWIHQLHPSAWLEVPWKLRSHLVFCGWVNDRLIYQIQRKTYEANKCRLKKYGILICNTILELPIRPISHDANHTRPNFASVSGPAPEEHISTWTLHGHHEGKRWVDIASVECCHRGHHKRIKSWRGALLLKLLDS